MEVNILDLVDDSKCYEILRNIRWEDGVQCPHCQGNKVKKDGHDNAHPSKQRYECKDCESHFDDLTGTIFSGSNKNLKVWVICLYFMGLNLSNSQIAKELDVSKPTAQRMTRLLRQGIVKKKAQIQLEGEVETDEVYVVCGHKGQADKVIQAERKPRVRRLKGARGRGTLENDKPPILGMIQRDGPLVLRMLPNVQQTTIEPIIKATISVGSLIYTDEYNIYNRLIQWGFEHKTVCHSKGEYARDEDGDGFHEVHVNTQEGIWSVFRSWLRPHRGISQEKMPIYVGFFEFVFNTRRRGKALLGDLFNTILAPDLRSIEELQIAT